MMLQAAVASSPPHAALVVLSFTPNSSDKAFTKNQWFS
jgi:hypothetical protein